MAHNKKVLVLFFLISCLLKINVNGQIIIDCEKINHRVLDYDKFTKKELQKITNDRLNSFQDSFFGTGNTTWTKDSTYFVFKLKAYKLDTLYEFVFCIKDKTFFSLRKYPVYTLIPHRSGGRMPHELLGEVAIYYIDYDPSCIEVKYISYQPTKYTSMEYVNVYTGIPILYKEYIEYCMEGEW